MAQQELPDYLRYSYPTGKTYVTKIWGVLDHEARHGVELLIGVVSIIRQDFSVIVSRLIAHTNAGYELTRGFVVRLKIDLMNLSNFAINADWADIAI